MAKLNITFVNEVGNNLNRYKAIDVNTGDEYLFDLSRNGTITTPGTPLNAEIMNAIVQAINEQFSNLVEAINETTPSDTKYPSEKAVVDYVGQIANEESVDVSDNVLIKTSGVSDNLALPPESQMEVNSIEGNSVVVNQYADCQTMTTSYAANNISSKTFTYNPDHKYLIAFDYEIETSNSGISFYYGIWNNEHTLFRRMYILPTTLKGTILKLFTSNEGSLTDYNNVKIMLQIIGDTISSSNKVTTSNVRFIDLTQWFGSNDNIPQDILNTPSNFFKHYKGSLAYDTGHIENGSGNLVDTNRNIWDEEWAVSGNGIHSLNKILVKPNTQYYFCNIGIDVYISINYYDNENNFITSAPTNTIHNGVIFTTPINCYSILFWVDGAYGTTYKNDICINVSDTNFNGTYVSHIKNTLNFGNDILRSAGNARDKKTFDGEITRKVGRVDLGTLNWATVIIGEKNHFYAIIQDLNNQGYDTKLLCAKYSTAHNVSQLVDKTISGVKAAHDKNIIVRDDSYTDAATFKAAMSGVYLNYELATPTTEQGTPYDNYIPVYYGGEEYLTGDVPFVINKNYDISIKDQVLTNVRVDKEQSEQIQALENTDKSLQQQINTIEEEFNESSVNITDTKIIKVSGLDDNLAIPEESQVEINKVVCGALVRNQYAKELNSTNWAVSSGNASYSDGVATFTVSSSNAILTQPTQLPLIVGHKYLMICDLKTNAEANNILFEIGYSQNYRFGNVQSSNWQILGGIIQYGDSGANNQLMIRDTRSSDWDAIQVKNIKFIDLTLTYGSTIADYLVSLSTDNAIAWLRANDPNIFKHRDYGSAIVNTNGDLITTNKNIWDEEWELGSYNTTNGEKITDNSKIRNKNPIRVSGNTTYNKLAPTDSVYWLVFYDINMNYIEYQGINYGSNTFTTPLNACYMNMLFESAYGTTYKHDICINVNDTKFNGKYVSHKQETQTLPSGYGIPKLDSNNKLTFDGDEIMDDKFNSSYDIVDLGTLNWIYEGGVFAAYPQSAAVADKGLSTKYKRVDTIATENQPNNTIQVRTNIVFIKDTTYTDATTFKAAMSGVMLVYEKAQPTQSTITPVHPMSCYKGGYELQSSDVPYTLTRNYDISIKDQVKTNVEVDREQSNAIDSLKNKVSNLETTVNDLESYKFDSSKLKIEQNLVNTILKYNNVEIDRIENLDVAYLPNIVFDVYQDSQFTAQEKVTITNSTDMDMYVSIKGLKEHNNLFVPFGESVTSQLEISDFSGFPDSYIATIEIKIYYNPKTNYNATTGYTVFENVKTINLRATVHPTDR